MGATLYDRLGGEAAVDAAVELFYRKVLGDARLSSGGSLPSASTGSSPH